MVIEESVSGGAKIQLIASWECPKSRNRCGRAGKTELTRDLAVTPWMVSVDHCARSLRGLKAHRALHGLGSPLSLSKGSSSLKSTVNEGLGSRLACCVQTFS